MHLLQELIYVKCSKWCRAPGKQLLEVLTIVFTVLPPAFSVSQARPEEALCIVKTVLCVRAPLFSSRPEQNLLHPGHGGTYIRDDTYPRG